MHTSWSTTAVALACLGSHSSVTVSTRTTVRRNVDKTSSNIVGKALNGRTGTVQRATEALLCYIELEQASAVVVSAVQAGQVAAVRALLPSSTV